jgi:TonB family protein
MKKAGKRKVSVQLAPVDVTSKMEMDKKGIYNRAEVRPEFPGGENALDAYLEREIQYPQPAIDNSTEGTVNVQFAVDEHGKISQAKETNTPLGDGLDDEALRVVENMPQWTPGKIKGKNVKTYYTLPIVFSIQ